MLISVAPNSKKYFPFYQRCNLDLDLDLDLADNDGLTLISISTSISEILIEVEVGPNRKILQWKIREVRAVCTSTLILKRVEIDYWPFNWIENKETDPIYFVWSWREDS